MSSSEEEVGIISRQNVKSSKFLSSDEDDDDVNETTRPVSSNIDNGHTVSQSTNTDRDGQMGDGGEFSSSSASNRSIQSVSTSVSSQLSCTSKNTVTSSSVKSSPISSKGSRSTSVERSTRRPSSSSEDDEKNRTMVGSQKSSHSESSPIRRLFSPKASRFNSSRTSKSGSSSSSESDENDRTIVENRAPSQSVPSLSHNQRKSSDSDSDEDTVSTKKSKSKKLLDSDEDENKSDATAVNESPKSTPMSEKDASGSEEPEAQISTKKKRKKRLVMSSDSDGSNEENDTTSRAIPSVSTKKSKSKKLLDSDEDENESDATAVNDSPKSTPMSEKDASGSEEPEAQILTKKKRKKRLVMNSDSDGSNNENDTTSSAIPSTQDEIKCDSEPECSNMTVKEKRRKKLEKLNEQKRSEFAKLVQQKKSRKSKKNDDESQTGENSEQPHEEKSQTKPKKFLLLSDDDLSDNEDPGKPFQDSDSENSDKKKKAKSTKRRNKSEAKSTKKRKKQKTNNEGTEDGAKKQRKPRSRAPKSDAKESKQTSKQQKEAMMEIKSTTQRMIREGRIALPYHQPKQRSLEEFLQRRNNVPSIPLRSSFDISSLAGERLLKKEKEVAEFYKSESENSEGELTIDETQNNEMSLQNNGETNASENCATDSALVCDNSSAKHDIPSVDTVKENVSSAEHGISIVDNESHSLDRPSTTVCNHSDLRIDEAENDKLSICDDTRIEGSLTHSDHRTNEEPTIAIISENTDSIFARIDQSSVKIVESDSLASSDLNLHLSASLAVPEKTEESLEKKDGTSTKNDDVHEENENLENEESISYRSTEIAKEDEACLSKDDDDYAPAQDTEDFQLEIENSCPIGETVESNVTTVVDPPVDPPVRVDPEALRKKKLELLSSRNVTLSDPKLKKGDNSVVQFEIESLPESEEILFENPKLEKGDNSVLRSKIEDLRIRSFKKKFANHVNAQKENKKHSAKINVTNVQTDSQGDVVDIVEETLTLKSLNKDEDDAQVVFAKPRSKYSLFKDAMLKTMISKKTANWSKYQDEKYSSFDRDDREGKDIDDEEEEEEEDSHIREPNFEPYHPEDEPDDEDLVEDDIDIAAEPNRKKNEYLDEEADVDFDEDENVEELDEDAYSEDEESDGENQEETPGADEENVDDQSKEKEVDSDEELLNSLLNESGVKKSTKADTRVPSKLFKNDITGEDLENKVLRLDSCSQFDDFSNTQIFSVCSGKFATQVEPPISNESSQFFADSQFPDDSQNFNLSMQDTNDGFQSKDEKITNVVDQSSFFLSDESDTEELFNKKRKAMQLEDSDDDESTKSKDDEQGEGLENGDNPNDDDVEDEEEEEDQGEDDLDGELGYNSEEEIVDYKKIKPTEFFENEAELSESEWGSEDENEKDLDRLEKEAGDDDEIDNDRLKEELGRIHMRHMMDDDQKNVRLLQEILLEDGDMHADGQRNRKFQWKNLDGDSFLKNFFGDVDDENVLIDDNDLNDDEKSKNWRQRRHEREIFLSKQEKTSDLLLTAEDENNSFIRISSTAKVTTKSAIAEGPTKLAPSKSPNPKFSFHPKSKCGSYLSRGQQLLNRIASNIGESKENKIQGAKNSRNFLFAAKTVEEVVLDSAPAGNQVDKRKISSKSVMARKKLKLVDGAADQTAPLRSGILAQLALSD